MDLIVPLRPARLPHRLWHAVFSAGLLLAPVLAVAGDALPAWSVPAAQGKPAARHENGFVAVDGRLYLTRGHMAGFVPWLDEFDPATGQWRALYDEIAQMREACGAAHMKAILATGDLRRVTARPQRFAQIAGDDAMPARNTVDAA